MSENIADFLNENAGVVGATAGYAVNRSIAATNRNIVALRGELGKLQQQFAHEKIEEERERLNRDMLFQVSQQIEAINSAPASAEMYLTLVRVSDDYQQLGFTSATFNSLQDKTFLSGVSSSIEQSFNTMWESFPEEVKEQIADMMDWHYLKELGDIVAIADRKIPSIRASFEATLKKAESLKDNTPSIFSNKALNVVMAGSLLLGVILIVLAANAGESVNKTTITFLGLASLSVCAIVFGVIATGLGVKRSRHFLEAKENSERSHYLRDQLVFLQSQRSALAQRLSQLQRVPIASVNLLISDAVKPQERFALVDQLGPHLADLCVNLGVDTERLPNVPERQAMDGLLSNRA